MEDAPMIVGKFVHRFRCPSCRQILERQVHGNVKTIESYCSTVEKSVRLRKVQRR
jgi:hypothetical protein